MGLMNHPERIANVSMTQFSIARRFGGIVFNGVHYVYDPATDECIREDVFRAALAKKNASEAPGNAELRHADVRNSFGVVHQAAHQYPQPQSCLPFGPDTHR